MNQLEINLTIWAICSILLFEILIIICLCRCCFNRIKPKKFYVKQNEYEYLQDINGGIQSKYHSTILRPPHAEELAHIGTIRAPNSFQNLGFYRDDRDGTITPTQVSSSPQQWLELQKPIINTAQLPPADYEIHSYRQPPLPPPPLTFIDFRQYRDNDDEIENYRLESFQHHNIILPQVQRLDTSTEYYGIQYTNVIPKSILKSGANMTPPIDLSLTPYLQIDHSRTSSKNDESPRTSVKINTDQSLPIDYPINIIEKRIPTEPILSSTVPSTSKYRMKFAYVNKLNDIEWEVPREFRTILQSNDERNPPFIIDSKIPISWKHETNNSQSHYLEKGDITQQQQAFEY